MQYATKKFTTFLAILIGMFSLSFSAHSEETQHTRFAYFGEENNDTYLGIKQSLSEANRQGRFLGQQYDLDVFESKLIVQDLSKHIAILTDTKNSQFLIDLANTYPNHPVFNLAITDTTLRETCYSNILHILPSDAMNSAALQQWQQKSPDTPAKAQAWHPDFKKYAARDLNKRFLKKQKVPMVDASWAGWAGAKMTWDTYARGEAKNSKEMLEYLKNDLSFDGQKGLNMSFRVTGQLIQPILLVAGDKIVAEAPVRGVAKSVDSLGILACTK